MDPGDIFAELFGDSFQFGFMGGPPRPRKGQDSIIPYDVTLEDLYNGKSVKMNMEKEIICTTCQGWVHARAAFEMHLTDE
jgi:DnaJ family protein A protein 2